MENCNQGDASLGDKKRFAFVVFDCITPKQSMSKMVKKLTFYQSNWFLSLILVEPLKFLKFQINKKNIAGLCEGLPQPKLRFMVGGGTTTNTVP
jgi:hypothetical protein